MSTLVLHVYACKLDVMLLLFCQLMFHKPEGVAGYHKEICFGVSDAAKSLSLDATLFIGDGGGGGVDPIPCMSTHRISDPRSGPAQLLPPHVKQRSHPHGVRPQIPDH